MGDALGPAALLMTLSQHARLIQHKHCMASSASATSMMWVGNRASKQGVNPTMACVAGDPPGKPSHQQTSAVSPGQIDAVLHAPRLRLLYDVDKNAAPVDLTGQVGLARHERVTQLTLAIKGHHNLSTERLQGLTCVACGQKRQQTDPVIGTKWSFVSCM